MGRPSGPAAVQSIAVSDRSKEMRVTRGEPYLHRSGVQGVQGVHIGFEPYLHRSGVQGVHSTETVQGVEGVHIGGRGTWWWWWCVDAATGAQANERVHGQETIRATIQQAVVRMHVCKCPLIATRVRRRWGGVGTCAPPLGTRQGVDSAHAHTSGSGAGLYRSAWPRFAQPRSA
jgi:hypothetical protein